MKTWKIQNERVEVGVIEEGGHLDPVRFLTELEPLEPMHKAPWVDEPDAADVPILQNLRGDFFCAPFGASDVLPDGRPHGAAANGRWELVAHEELVLELELSEEVSGARVRKRVELRPKQPVVYQTHMLKGGEGELPLGHHAMLRAPKGERLNLGFGPWVWAGTPPEPVETPKSGGRSRLAYPQVIHDLTKVATAGGGAVDLTVFPSLERSEEIVMLVADPGYRLGWTAAVAPRSGWAWFALKNAEVLKNTVLWLSNGGRDYPPFSGRHERVIGLEEVTGYFHLGHQASLSPNPLKALGHPTTLALEPSGERVVRYAFGLTHVPEGFERVTALECHDDRVVLTDGAKRVDVPFEGTFFEF